MAAIYRVYGQKYNADRLIVQTDSGKIGVHFIYGGAEEQAVRETVRMFEKVTFIGYMSVTQFKREHALLYRKVAGSF